MISSRRFGLNSERCCRRLHAANVCTLPRRIHIFEMELHTFLLTNVKFFFSWRFFFTARGEFIAEAIFGVGGLSIFC